MLSRKELTIELESKLMDKFPHLAQGSSIGLCCELIDIIQGNTAESGNVELAIEESEEGIKQWSLLLDDDDFQDLALVSVNRYERIKSLLTGVEDNGK